MKKLSFLIIFCIIAFFSVVLYNNYTVNKINESLLFGLNGGNILEIKTSSKVKDIIQVYQNNNFVANDYQFILCDNVEMFNNYKEFAIKAEKELEKNPFCVVENLEGYDVDTMEEYSKYYSFDILEKEERVKYKENQYLIDLSDLAFDTEGVDIVKYGHFLRYVYKKDVSKITFAQAQKNKNIMEVGHYKENGEYIFTYYDKQNKCDIEIKVKLLLGLVISCENK